MRSWLIPRWAQRRRACFESRACCVVSPFIRASQSSWLVWRPHAEVLVLFRKETVVSVQRVAEHQLVCASAASFRSGSKLAVLFDLSGLIADPAAEQIAGSCSSSSVLDDVLDFPAYPALPEVPRSVERAFSFHGRSPCDG